MHDRTTINVAVPPLVRGSGYLVAFIVICVLSFPAYAQQDMSARLNRLENEIQTLRVSQIEADVATLTGKIEQQNFILRQFQERIEKVLADLEMRVGDVETRTGSGAAAKRPGMQGFDTRLQATPSREFAVDAPAMSSGQASGAVPSDVVKPGTEPGQANGHLGSLMQSPTGTFSAAGNTPADAYEQAFGMMRDKDYAGAEKSFEGFLARYPGHDLAANAKYWLGETFYVRGNYERAARIFAEAYQLYPKGPKGPDNLLKLALSLNGLGKKDDACLTLVQLIREYPSGAGPVLARAKRERANLGCK